MQIFSSNLKRALLFGRGGVVMLIRGVLAAVCVIIKPSSLSFIEFLSSL